jgi:hypothetical protein
MEGTEVMVATPTGPPTKDEEGLHTATAAKQVPAEATSPTSAVEQERSAAAAEVY